MATSFATGFRSKLARLLLLGGALLLFAVTVLHSAGYVTAAIALANSSLAPELKAAFKGLWLGFSLQGLVTALVVAVAAIWPRSVSSAVWLICALLPTLNAALLINFLGSFWGGLVLALGALLVLAGTALRPGPATSMEPLPKPIPGTDV